MIGPVCEDALVSQKRDLNNGYYSLVLSPFSQADKFKPGQFVHIRIPSTEVYFRRAFSVAAILPAKQEIEIIFKVFGRGTRLLGDMRCGDTLDIMGPLGNPYKFPPADERAIMVAGGVGFPPLLFLAQEMIQRGHPPDGIDYFYGGHTKADLVETNRLRDLGIKLHLVTDDGSVGEAGLVTDAAEKPLQNCKTERIRLYGCGPEGMLKATDELGQKYGIPGQLALEALMPCGTGICLGCVVPIKSGGYARVCCEGPVFDIGVVAFDS